VQVEYAGLRSQPVTVPVRSSAPGIYCVAGGSGLAAPTNIHAGRPVAHNNIEHSMPPGGYLTFFITGEGETTLPWADGLVPVPPLFPTPAAPVLVRIGGVSSDCPGNWAGVVYPGVTQIDACVPAGAPTGNAVPLEVSVGGVSAQAGVTIRVGTSSPPRHDSFP
jgi:uncharacterized protein (TIGR03437 family)